MAELLTTQGIRFQIDDEDVERVSAHSWTAHLADPRLPYVRAFIRDANGIRHWVGLHRFLMNAPKGVEVDHRNHDTLDNRKANLRFATRAQQAMNRRKSQRETLSRFKGVSWNARDRAWVAQIKTNRKNRCLGYFADEIGAAKAYDAAAADLFGEFAHVNFPKGGDATV